MKTNSTLHDIRHTTVVQILKKARLDEKLTQDDLADRLGGRISRVYVSKVESGDRNLTLIELIDYCNALKTINIHQIIDAIDMEKTLDEEIYDNEDFLIGYATGFLHGKGENVTNSISARIIKKEKIEPEND